MSTSIKIAPASPTVAFLASQCCKLSNAKWLFDMIKPDPEWSYKVQANQLETSGDIEEFQKHIELEIAWINGDSGFSPMQKLGEYCNFVQSCWGVIGIDELRAIPTIQIFQSQYPAIMRTFEVWAWG